jgi:methylated-DNA-[protein]-cysteine S-methyltransferase
LSEFIYRTQINTPAGRMVALASKRGLCALEFDRPERMALMTRRLARWHGTHTIKEANHPILTLTKHWFRDYFKGRFGKLKTPPLDIRGTAFEKRVWKELLKIKPGHILSYARMAKKLGKYTAARAVGGASARNPVALIIPCHRLVGSNGSLTGYGGGIACKGWLLAHEKEWDKGH